MHKPLRTVLSYVQKETLPPDWTLVAVGDVLLGTQYGMNCPSVADGTTAIVGMKDIQDGRVLSHRLAKTNVSEGELESYRLRRGDLLLNRTNSLDQVGKVGLVDADRDYVFASYLVRLNVNTALIEPEYLNYWLNSDLAQRTIKRIATPAIGQANVNPTEFQKYCLVPLPPKAARIRIADILRTWDRGIEAMERELSLVRKQFLGIQQGLLSEAHFKQLGWKLKPLSEIADRVRRKTDGGDHAVMTISGKVGFLRQDEKFSRYMAGESVENYTLLKAGEFAYNKGNSKTYPQGCIYRLEQDNALVPHVYISFKLHDGLCVDFYAALFRSGFLNRQLTRLINSGVRNDGLLNLNIHEFFGCKVPVPSTNDQVRTARLIATARQEVTSLESQIRLMKKQKDGLIQKLLTGEWRVPVRDSDVDAAAARVTEEAAQ